MEKKLLARRKQAEDSFNTLAQQKIQKEKEINEIETELARLQGEYRLVDDILNKKAEASKVSPKPEVIDVDAATGAKE